MEEQKKLQGFMEQVIGDLDVTGNLNAGSFTGDGTLIMHGCVYLAEQSADPADPVEGQSCIWQSDGTGAGDDGDILMKITVGGSTKTATLVDFSTV